MTQKNGKRPSNKGIIDEVMAGATEKVLKRIRELYDGVSDDGDGGKAGSTVGLKAIADSPQLRMQVRRPRKKITVMIIGNHSAGKSSFINWYIGEDIQKTGVAIETRGFTFVTCGKKRETLSGDATLRYFDYLDGFGKFPGIVSNLFTEVSASKEKSFSCVDLIDTPGLVDGDMQYPFDVKESILWLADHVDLILIFFDPIGQATCKRTMEVVQALNHGPHLEKIFYFMSKADAVEKEEDRQRVLIQITWNLATRIRNSHAFKLPTFYLPQDNGAKCSVPNSIHEVCQEIDKAINQGVQRNLKSLQDDCESIQKRISDAIHNNKKNKAINTKNTFQGITYYLLAMLALCATILTTTLRTLPTICDVFKPVVCELDIVHNLKTKVAPDLVHNFGFFFTITLATSIVCWVLAKVTWRVKPVFSKKDIQKMTEYSEHVKSIAELEQDLYAQYFKSLKLVDEN